MITCVTRPSRRNVPDERPLQLNCIVLTFNARQNFNAEAHPVTLHQRPCLRRDSSLVHLQRPAVVGTLSHLCLHGSGYANAGSLNITQRRVTPARGADDLLATARTPGSVGHKHLTLPCFVLTWVSGFQTVDFSRPRSRDSCRVTLGCCVADGSGAFCFPRLVASPLLCDDGGS